MALSSNLMIEPHAAGCAGLLPFARLIHTELNAAGSFRGLYNNGNAGISMPFKLIGFTRSLSDKGFPGDVHGYLGIAVPIAHPADYCVRIYGDRSVGHDIAYDNWIAVG